MMMRIPLVRLTRERSSIAESGTIETSSMTSVLGIIFLSRPEPLLPNFTSSPWSSTTTGAMPSNAAVVPVMHWLGRHFSGL